MNHLYRVLTLWLALSVMGLTGCAATLHPTSPLPEGCAITPLGKVDKSGPLAVSRDGAVATVADAKIQVFSLSGGPGRIIAEGIPAELAFSPSGDRLAAVFNGKGESTLRLYDLTGKVLAETAIPNRVTDIAWRSDKELFATSLEIKRFSFGAELVGSLHRWDTVRQPVASPLSDLTVRPMVAKLPEEILYRSLMLAISPYGDEFVYTSLKDPPMFTPYLSVRIKHIDAGAERQVVEIGIGSGEPQFAPDGETLLAGDAGSLSRRISLPAGKELDAWPSPGDHLQVSPGGAYLYLDGHLYRDGKELTSFPKQAQAVFLPDGSGLVVRDGGGLFLVSGLSEPKRPALPTHSARILELRRLRILNLITETEYQSSRKKALAP